MAPFVLSRSAIIAVGLTVLFFGGIGMLPLLDGPGYEVSLVAGLFLPFVVGSLTALQVSGSQPEPLDSFCRGIANGAALSGVAFAVVLLHGLRTGFCDVSEGTLNFALGPAIGALMAGAWGAVSGEIARGRKRRVTRVFTAVSLATLAPLVSIALSFSRFYSSPMIFAYDPFVGYFSGSLYDTIIDLSGLITYRAGTAASLFAFFVTALHLGHDERGRLAYQAIGRPGLLLFGAVSAAGSIVCTLSGDRLGHWQTAATIDEALGAAVSGERCDVVYPRAMPIEDARRFARDCDAHVVAGEKWLGGSGPPRIKAYLFESAGQKQRLMGAANTYIAKPWRAEVYLQAKDYPHRVLGHEIAHVLAAPFGRGPFAVASSHGGFVPNPGLIEGLAVAASPKDGDLTPAEWAKTMKDLDLLPPLERLFALGFLGENSSRAYTVSGAFVSYIHERFGAEAVRAWYGGADLGEVTKQSWAELESSWHTELDGISVSEAALAQAKARFDRPAIFGRSCPRVVDACRRRARRLADRGDEHGAIEQYTLAAELDPENADLRISMATLRARADDDDGGGRAELEKIASTDAVPRHMRDHALEALADLDLVAGRGRDAVRRYEEIASRLVDEGHLRTLEVKSYAATNEDARPAIIALLLWKGERLPDRATANDLLGAWGQRSLEDGLPHYLLGRYYGGQGDYERATARLDTALERKQPIVRVTIEAERLQIIAACARTDSEAAHSWYARYVLHSEVPKARKQAMFRLVTRCTGTAPEVSAPAVGSPEESAPSEDDPAPVGK